MIMNILVVDDIESNLLYLELLLKKIDTKETGIDKINIIKSVTGKEALQITMTQEIDLILLDIFMPDMDGFEVAKNLKLNDKTKDIPVIFVTATFKSHDFIEKGYSIGAIDYFTKPIERFEFLNRINLYIKLFVNNKKLQDINKSLKQRVKDEVRKNLDKEIMLLQQSKLASMGEMIGNIAHQWRQPLSALSLVVSNIKDAYDYGKLDDTYINKSVKKSNMLIKKMSNTIDDFRNFFSIDKKKSVFSIQDNIDEVLSILEGSIEKQNITINKHYKNICYIDSFANEYSQVLLNIFNNAIDALVKNEIKFPTIEVTVDIVEDSCLLSIGDNAGGISIDIVDRIFEPYFSTKLQHNGTGIGLYMSKTIIEEHMGGKLTVRNGESGAVFDVLVKPYLQSL